MELKPLVSPRSLVPDRATLTREYGKFTAEPFERGYGRTIGNSLRRILLSSIQGAAVTSYQIENVKHEFSHIPGVKEDVTDITLNLKSLIVKLTDATEGTLYLNAKGPMVVRAGDFQMEPQVAILNPGQHIATLDVGASLVMEVTVRQGRGYQAAPRDEQEREAIGIIPVDAAFSPIRNVRYHVENARVGQETEYDRLILEVWTNGSVGPDEAISFAARILKDYMDLFITIEDQTRQVQELAEEEEEISPIAALQEKLDKSIEELELSVRSYNCLEAAGIKTIRDLVQKTEADMLKYRNFGRKSLNEIKAILKDMGLQFNMKIDPTTGLPVVLPDQS
ncbi:MAG: DNA-directed RNA polymerase subunit alpha [Candidatus Sumerlaeia bacterium]|nr:DNA-directed RNA polymerase subunit alpha [Candidatus Sumerlaeia bacterium]